MSPTLQDGGYAIIRFLDRSEWAKMPDERIFVVSDMEGKSYLKRVKNRFKKGFIVLKSDNPDQASYPNFNLTAEEILAQLLTARDRLGDFPDRDTPDGAIVPAEGRKVSNIVMMGMGEPLYNFEEVKKALLIASDGDGLSLSKRRITLSTSGVVPGIARTGEEIGVMLAISLHAPNDDLRDLLVPINKKYPLEELMDACRKYPGLSNARRITFEYVMLKDVNDSIDDARALVKLLKGIPAKINLIPFNPWPGTNYQCSDWETIEKFADFINNAGYASPIRTPRGRDILAACGQLKSESERLKKHERLALEAMMIAGHGEA